MTSAADRKKKKGKAEAAARNANRVGWNPIEEPPSRAPPRRLPEDTARPSNIPKTGKSATGNPASVPDDILNSSTTSTNQREYLNPVTLTTGPRPESWANPLFGHDSTHTEESKALSRGTTVPSRGARSVRLPPKTTSPTQATTSSPNAGIRSPKAGDRAKGSFIQMRQRPRHLGQISGLKSTNIVTNHFRIKLGQVTTLYQYTVTLAKSETEDEKTKRTDKYHKGLKDRGEPMPGDPKYNPPGPPQILPRVRRRLIYLLIKNLRSMQDMQTPTDIDVASDYHNFLVTVFPIPEHVIAAHVVDYYGEQEQGPAATPPTYVATIDRSQTFPIQNFSKYLSPRGPDTAGHSANQDDILRALNMIFSRRPNFLTFADLDPGTNREQEMGRVGANKFYDRRLIGYPAVPVRHTRNDRPPWPFPSWDANHSGLFGWPGFFFSSRASFRGDLMLNLNSTTSAFYTAGRLMNFIKLFHQNITRAFDWQLLALAELLRGVRVVTTYLNKSSVEQGNGQRPERITAIVDLPNRNFCTARSLMIPGFNRTTVLAYFQQKHPHTPVNPDGLVVALGSQTEPEYILAELLKILPMQTFKGKLDMVEEAIRLPDTNRDMIDFQGKELLAVNSIEGPAARFNGLTIEEDMLGVDACRLNGPQVGYLNKPKTRRDVPKPTAVKKEEIDRGAWNLKGMRFAEPATSGAYWSVLELTRDVSCNPGVIDTMFADLSREMQGYGITDPYYWYQSYNDHRLEVTNQRDPNEILQDEQKLITRLTKMRADVRRQKNEALKLVFILLPAKEVGLYALVKRVADQKVGMHTVCIVCQRRRGKPYGPPSDPPFLGNVLLKFNLKMGVVGVNQKLMPKHATPILNDDTMLIGADVTHPGPSALVGSPSLAAVVGSVDIDYAQFPASFHENIVDVESESKEEIMDMAIMVQERVQHWISIRGKCPKQVVFYRDGLSESQFEMCCNNELPRITEGIRAAIQAAPNTGANFDNPPLPKILLICTIKRHHTRFYAPTRVQKDYDLFNSKGNPLPGVVVDNHVTYGEGRDFFLYSHASILGTSKPIHYVVLENQLDANLEEIATMTHHLCYLYGRSTRSVSLAPPAYYADLAADRARHYVRHIYNAPRSDPPVAWNRQVHGFNVALSTVDVGTRFDNSMFYI